MRIIKIITLALIVGAASIAARQVIHTRVSNTDKLRETKSEVQSQQAIRVVAAVPRDQTGQYDLRDIALLDNGNAWAVGYDGQHVDRLYFSNDRGKTWKAMEVPGTGFTMQAITFSDSQHGWAVGGNGLIIRTINAGKSWELLKPPTRTEAGIRVSDLHAVHFANSSVGYVAGNKRYGNKINDEVEGSVEIFCTKDGGETWQKCYQENLPLSIFQITTISQSSAFAVLGSHLIRTDNQGETWQRVSTSAKYMSSIAFAPDGTGWLVGSHGVFQHSTDGGKTWQQPSSLTQDFVNRGWWALAFNSIGTGLAIGEDSTLALTIDNGKTWEVQTPITTDPLRAIRLQGSRAVLLGAQNAYSIDISPTSAQQVKR